MKMTHGIGATILLVWSIILVVRPSSAIEISKEQLLHLGNFPTETCDLTESGQLLARTYSQFLVRLRNKMRAKMSCNIPVTRSNLPAGSEYVLVELKVGTRSVTLALQANNLYVIAYRVGGPSGQTPGIFLNEANVRDAMSKLFSKSETQRTLPYDGSYPALSGAGAKRKNVDLGLLELKKGVEAIQGTVTAVEEARFLLVAIQMVAEATRFKYIENLVVGQGLTKSFKPDDEMLDYENNWGKISKAVHQSQKQVPNQCVTIKPSIVIGKKTLTLVSDIRNDVGILMYDNDKASGHQMFSQIVASSFNDVADIAADVGEL